MGGLMELLVCAERFDVPALKLLCERELFGCIGEQNVCHVLVAAHRQGAAALARFCVQAHRASQGPLQHDSPPL